MKSRAFIFTVLLVSTYILGLSEFSNAGDAELTLKTYLEFRGKRNFKKCCEFYTDRFRASFIRNFGNICPDWFIESEMHFKRSRILDAVDGDPNKFIVETTIEDPTSIQIYTTAIENYDLVVEKGEWKIDNWSIEYK